MSFLVAPVHDTLLGVVQTLVGCPDASHSLLRNSNECQGPDYEPFRSYCAAQWALYHLYDGERVAAESHAEYQLIISRLRRGFSRAEILGEMQARMGTKHSGAGDVCFENSLHLIARLLVMLRIGRGPGEYEHDLRMHVAWDDDRSSLRGLVSRQFTRRPMLACERVAFPRLFDAWSIEAIGGIEIVLTDNLADHLDLIEEGDGVKLFIFHHASYLEWQDDTFFPDGLLGETHKTLALLFPERVFGRSGNRQKKSWLASVKRRNIRNRSLASAVDTKLGCCDNVSPLERRIENFHFWRDRLVILKQAYDEATPQTVSQWWYDRRNGVQWYTFWVAILVLLITTGLSTIQCIEGALQVYKAFNE